MNTLVMDLQVETERRMELEKQRVEWLVREAVDGVNPEDGEADGILVFEAENHEETDVRVDGAEEQAVEEDDDEHSITDFLAVETPPLPPPLPDSLPLIGHLRDLFSPLTARQKPLQKSLHDLSLSLNALRSSLPVPPLEPDSTSPVRSKKSTFPNLSLKTGPPTSDPVFVNMLDSIHEVIEDARVDVEISMADEERVYRGFEALLGVGSGSGAVQGKEVMRDAREFVEERRTGEDFTRLSTRVEDVEHDLALLKRTVHEVEGMEVDKGEVDGGREGKQSIWQTLELRTITPTATRVVISSLASSPSDMDGHDSSRRTGLLSSVGSVGRSFSASVVGAPRRVSTMAGGLYRAPKLSIGMKDKADHESGPTRNDDDVE